MSGLLIAGIVFGTVLIAELPDNSGLASLVLGTRYRAGGVIAGAFAAFAVHVVLAVTCGSLLGLLPHKIVQIAVAVVFLAGAVLVLRGDSGDDDEDVPVIGHEIRDAEEHARWQRQFGVERGEEGFELGKYESSPDRLERHLDSPTNGGFRPIAVD